MLKIIEQQESQVIKHRSKNVKKTDKGFAGFLQTFLMDFLKTSCYPLTGTTFSSDIATNTTKLSTQSF